MGLTKTNYVDKAEKVIDTICKRDRRIVTTSKLRNILSMISDIYNDARHLQGDKLDEDMMGRVQYLKMRVAYEAGRESTVDTLVKEAGLFDAIDEIGNSRDQLMTFCHYMEALVAYRKYLVHDRDE